MEFCEKLGVKDKNLRDAVREFGIVTGLFPNPCQLKAIRAALHATRNHPGPPFTWPFVGCGKTTFLAAMGSYLGMSIGCAEQGPYVPGADRSTQEKYTKSVQEHRAENHMVCHKYQPAGIDTFLRKYDSSPLTPKDYLKKPYARVFVPDVETGTVTCFIQEFPGCVTEYPDSHDGIPIAGAYQQLEDVAEEWIEASLEAGHKIPTPNVLLGK